MGFKKIDRCGKGDLVSCDNFIKSDAISQYHDEVTVTDRSHDAEDQGNLIDIADALRSTKAELFRIVCECFNGYEDIENAPEIYLECLAHNLGVGQEICNHPITDRKTFETVIKNRILELGNPFITLGELNDRLVDIFGESFDLCQDKQGCINILMNRELSEDEKNNMKLYLDSLPIPLDKCVKLYPDTSVKCFFFNHDEENPNHGGWNEANWNCEDHKIYTRNNYTDKQQDIKQCFCWNAPFIPNTPYGFHEECAGWGAGAMWNCATDEEIEAEEKTISGDIGDKVELSPIIENEDQIKSYEWRDENRLFIGEGKSQEIIIKDGSNLILFKAYGWDGELVKYIIFHIIGK